MNGLYRVFYREHGHLYVQSDLTMDEATTLIARLAVRGVTDWTLAPKPIHED